MKKRTEKELVEHFWSKVRKINGKCWKWRGSHFETGYPMFHVDRIPIQATRFMLKIINGEMPRMALHKCDKRWCINPDHLYDGSQKDNMRDRMERGVYYNRHTGHKRAKLKGWRFAEFKARVLKGEPPFRIGKEYGIHGATACKIAKKLFSNQSQQEE
jgi:hypothetical protein